MSEGCLIGNGITVCRGHWQKKIVGRTKKKWCFKCRIHIVHDKMLHTEKLIYTDKGELINGYYEPYITYECRKCHEDNTDFPWTHIARFCLRRAGASAYDIDQALHWMF